MEDSKLAFLSIYADFLCSSFTAHNLSVMLLHSITLLHCMTFDKHKSFYSFCLKICVKRKFPLFIPLWMCSFHSIQGLILRTSLLDSRIALHTAMYKWIDWESLEIQVAIMGDIPCNISELDYNLLLIPWRREELLNVWKMIRFMAFN